MKSITALVTISGLFAVLISPVQAQDETDDLYINSKDIAKRKEQAKQHTSVESTYYSYPQGSGNSSSNSISSSSSSSDRFSDPGYTNKYIEAEKNERMSTPVSGTQVNSNTQSYNSDQSEDIKWYKNNKRNLRRKAYGSQYTINPAIGYNNYSGWNTSIGFGYNSGWNNWYGWNSPYYNGWNNYGYGGYSSFGMGFGYGYGNGFYNPYSFGNYYYSPGWFVGYNSYGGYNSGFGYGFGNFGYNPYAWGAWGNPYYGWRPVVYVPVNSYSNGNSGSHSVSYGPLNDRSSPAQRNNYSQNQINPGNPNRYSDNNNLNVGGSRGGGTSVSPDNSNSNNRGGGDAYRTRVPSRDGYSNPQPSSQSGSTYSPSSNQRIDGESGNRNYSVPSRDRSDNSYSRPSSSWGSNQGSGNGGYSGSRGGGDFGGNSGGNNRMGGGGGGSFGGGSGGGGGGRVPGGR